MFSLLALAALAPPLLGPKLPPSNRQEFQAQFIAAEEALAKGDFDRAKQAIGRLPVGDVAIQLDKSGLSPGLKRVVESETNGAIEFWRHMQSLFAPKVVSSGGQLLFRFVTSLPPNPESGLPASSTLKFNSEPGQPQLEVVIGLNRGLPMKPATDVELYNEIAHGIGAYYGLADSPYFGSFMSHSDLPADRRAMITGFEGIMVGNHIRAVEELRKLVASQTRIVVPRPRVTITPLKITAPNAVQGRGAPFNISLTNSGNAPLTFRIFPDCSCMLMAGAEDIAPGQTMTVKGRMDTSNGLGDVKHRLAIFTNDFSNPLTMVEFEGHVSPRYRFLIDEPRVQLVPKGKITIHAYLFPSDGNPIHPTAIRVDGMPATFTQAPWTGELSDPTMNEGPLTRRGTDIAVTIDTTDLVGIGQFTISADTDDPEFRTIHVQHYVQRGIAAQPAEVYFGDVAGPQTTSFILSQPGKPFKILSTSFNSPFFQVKGTQLTGAGEYKLDLEYVGKAPVGTTNAVLTIQTDDPEQPLVKVPVQVTVR